MEELIYPSLQYCLHCISWMYQMTYDRNIARMGCLVSRLHNFAYNLITFFVYNTRENNICSLSPEDYS